jgi:hypothetical protein
MSRVRRVFRNGFSVSLPMLFMFSTAAMADSLDVVRASATGSTLSAGRKDYAEYDLIVREMQYIEDDTGEGFKPAKVETVTGAIDRVMFDYHRRKSAIEIYRRVLSTLEREKYDIIYRCSGSECGGVGGWRLFLSKKLGGEQRYQHYVAAVQKGRGGPDRYVAFYVNDLGGQTRALLDTVRVGGAAGPTREASVYFDTGASALDNRSQQLNRIREFATRNGSRCPIRVVGYTDPVGTEPNNQVLAEARVNAVVQYLRKETSVAANCWQAEPRGIDKSTGLGGANASSRRVELVVAEPVGESTR